MRTRLLNEVFDKLCTVQMTLGEGAVWIFFAGGLSIVCTVLLMFSGVRLYDFYSDKVLFATVKRMYLFALIFIVNVFGLFGGFKSDFVICFNIVSVFVTTVVMYIAVVYVLFVAVVHLIIGFVIWMLSVAIVASIMKALWVGNEYVAYGVAFAIIIKIYGKYVVIGVNNFIMSLTSLRYFVVSRG